MVEKQESAEFYDPNPIDTTPQQSDTEPIGSLSSPGVPPCDTDDDTYPEGGLTGWLCVFGSFMGLMASLGLVNSLGSFQAYLERHQLREYSSGKIGWIFSLYTFLTFFCGILIGPIFDARGPQALIFLGSVLLIATMVTLGFCTEYWHFILSFGVCGGLGTSLVFTPAIAAVGHFFFQKRGIATGIAAGGGAIGGILLPLVLESLFDKIGFAWATRVVALIWLVSLGIACILMTSRLPTKPFSKENILPPGLVLGHDRLNLKLK
ncbi:MFS domain-containing protein [Fusarium falciforme]|uniref:MFS domain-containing protein n=1 Tax=Fusarium falciforme TaxID=195108 RepID=UPI002300CAE8|nr:MFS domain-containing protein [Fusarium falciforme]WAO96909.1 MFS domain-containing protein [Fusarium falciforme]